jgi:hypothetical protein
MLREHDSLVLGFGDAAVCHHPASVELNLDIVLGLAHLNAAADPLHRDRIAVAVQCHIPFGIDQALLQPVDFRNPRRQRASDAAARRRTAHAEPREYVSCKSR